MDPLNTEFKRKFSFSMYKNLKIKLSEMSFSKDFVTDRRGDLYPVISKSEDCDERVEYNRYSVSVGSVSRMVCQFFPFATYELSCRLDGGIAGFEFALPSAKASVAVSGDKLMYSCGETAVEVGLPSWLCDEITVIVSCRPEAFDVYFRNNGGVKFFHTFEEPSFKDSNLYSQFRDGTVSLCVSGNAEIREVLSYIDNGISIADMRPIRYESGEVMMELGKVYFTASIRMRAKMFQGVFSWVPGTAEIELAGALFYDAGDGRWCGDVAASVLYHRGESRWYLWVCSFNHDHILGHSVFEGDPRFGVNVVDITLMDKAPEGADVSEFLGFSGDEDPDFYYDAERGKWSMAICRLDLATRKYRYVFFESDKPFEGYKFIGKGLDGAETGGSFVKVGDERFFICGNDFNATSDYRIYHKGGMTNAKFNYPDGGFRGWGTLIPVKQGSRTRYFWLTFDRHNGSDYNWSYGNLYCFEA